ncbi:hypothetical protein PS854_02155 [Pseudomonas fluorescens]|uniref:Uncharacterized protein n=1 Tax=Pseudomonas fluorescens TaxID=294 RepID=A0A5E7JJM8_PSEFL|nr:hypothetical protein [Pseudomonas fluorescens]VVO88114.1 hypothetical protein PS854_02155 [Pseudomonas fluorescens]
MATNAVSTRSRALGMHLVLVLSVCLLASQLLVAKPAPPTPVPAKETAVADTATPWGGDYFPNTLLTDQDGRQVRFLFERFDKIPMPNLRMDEHAAQSIIAFLPAQTDRQHPPASALAAGNDEPEHRHAIAGPAKATVQ